MKQPSENSSDLHKIMSKMCIRSENKPSTISIEVPLNCIFFFSIKKKLKTNFWICSQIQEHVHFGEDKAIESCSSSEDRHADVQSTSPADYNDEDRLFHLNFIQNEAGQKHQVAPKR